MARIYATPADLADYTGKPAPPDALLLLARATAMLEARILRLCWYCVDNVGMPTDPLVLAAIQRAVCAQVQWWEQVGDSIGAVGAGWASVSIGSASLSRPSAGPGGEDSAARQVAPQVWDELQSPDLGPDRFRIGAVTSW